MALSTAKEIEDFADKLTESADTMNKRRVAAAKIKSISLEDSQKVKEQCDLLRQEANSLYIDTAKKVLQDLEMSQDEILGIIDEAKSRIERIDKIEKVLVIVTQLLDLVAKVQSADIKGVVSVSEDLKSQFES